jgi:hypothetical protein
VAKFAAEGVMRAHHEAHGWSGINLRAGVVANDGVNGEPTRYVKGNGQTFPDENPARRGSVPATFGGHVLPKGAGPYAGWLQYEPLGGVGIISPWNFPMNVMCRKALPAPLTGNTVVFKPATFTPWTGIHMAQPFEQAGFPAGNGRVERIAHRRRPPRVAVLSVSRRASEHGICRAGTSDARGPPAFRRCGEETHAA